MKIKILTDSTCDLDQSALKKHDIYMIPLNVHFGERSFKDGIDLLPGEFYRMLKTDPNHPKTSQPSPEDFKAVYKKLLEDGSAVISIHLSSKMSGTIQSANIAKNELQNERIHIIDSGYVSFILGLMAVECSEAVKKGKSISEIFDMIEEIKKRMQIYFIVDTLEYLHKGGRIGRASVLIGGLLKIKPILTIKEGQVCPFEKIRGMNKVFERLYGLFADFISKNDLKKIKTGFAHADSPELLQQFKDKISEVYDSSNALITNIGPVVGSHAGPGTLGICFYPEIG